MILLGAFLAMAAGQAQALPTPSMVVSEEQFAASLPICRDQLARPQFVTSELDAAGWPKVVSAASDGASATLATYRNPENMLLLSLLDFPAKPDQCVIMVPFGPTLDVATVVAQISAFIPRGRDRDGGWPTWRSDTLDVSIEPMAAAGARILFTKRGS